MSAPATESIETSTVFDARSKTFYKYRWLDGNIIDEVDVEIEPLSNDAFWRYLRSLSLKLVHNKKGETVSDVETMNAKETARDLFESLYATANLPAGETDKFHETFPVDRIPHLLNSTVMNVASELPVFRRNDPKAPPTGETVIKLRIWSGQIINQDQELEDRFVEANLYFRTPKAADYEAWGQAEVVKTQPYAKGNTARITHADDEKLREILFGSEEKKMQPLFLRADSYLDNHVLHYHVYYAACHLLQKDVDLGKLSKQLKPQS